MESFVAVFKDLRKDVKNLITTLQALNKEFGTLKMLIESMGKLQETMERNEGLMKKLVDGIEEMNQNISNLMKIAEAMKE